MATTKEIRDRKQFYAFYDKIHIDPKCTNPDNVKMQQSATFWLSKREAELKEVKDEILKIVEEVIEERYKGFVSPLVFKSYLKEKGIDEKLK